MSEKRKDNKGRILKTGESQRPNGTYGYRYRNLNKKEQWVYAATLSELRVKEQEVQRLLQDGIDYSAGNETVLGLAKRYASIRNGTRVNTQIGYKYVLNLLEKYEFSTKKIRGVKQAFYIYLNQQVGYSYSTITTVRGALKPAFKAAVADGVLYRPPSPSL